MWRITTRVSDAQKAKKNVKKLITVSYLYGEAGMRSATVGMGNSNVLFT